MKNDFQGIIYTLQSDPSLKELVAHRNSASLPFGGRYRLIDFSLSSMVNAGIRDVGVIMEKDYQSLLDHLSNGKDWGLTRHSGGLRLLPPFGLREAHSGVYAGCMEALTAVRSYIESIPHENIVLTPGDTVGNVDLAAAMERHAQLGADITAVCVDRQVDVSHHRFVPGADGYAEEMIFSTGSSSRGLASTEIYLLKKDLLLSLMDYCSEGDRAHFHRDALAHYLAGGGRVGVYVHPGYFRRVFSAQEYYDASIDMLDKEVMTDFFPEDRPIRTKERAEVSTYYSDEASVKNCLVADGCYIEGRLENCILFRGVKVGKGAKLKNCVILQDAVVGAGADLSHRGQEFLPQRGLPPGGERAPAHHRTQGRRRITRHLRIPAAMRGHRRRNVLFRKR